MGLFKKPHPDCGATVKAVYPVEKGRFEVDVSGCQRTTDHDQLTFGRRIKDPEMAVSAAQELLDTHREKGLFDW